MTCLSNQLYHILNILKLFLVCFFLEYVSLTTQVVITMKHFGVVPTRVMNVVNLLIPPKS